MFKSDGFFMFSAIAVAITIIFMSCYIESEKSSYAHNDSMFQVISDGYERVGDDTFIWVIRDKETNAEYIVAEGLKECSITPRLGKVGK